MTSELALMNVKGVAEILSISPRSIWRLVSAGKMPPPLKIGASCRWRKNDISQWIQNDCRYDGRRPMKQS